ncbi:hypothetical protein [Vineibacter terrae]|uniref:tetratricopeptide repeat protein n=1 Tax=Vineibacter terrae TaxID=2586908 RepID=UPI002E32F030|nr:hypothetical protein [Vineibacter terrae]HEX2892003.1 hypothetical protein [Vineibacter terrae]
MIALRGCKLRRAGLAALMLPALATGLAAAGMAQPAPAVPPYMLRYDIESAPQTLATLRRLGCEEAEPASCPLHERYFAMFAAAASGDPAKQAALAARILGRPRLDDDTLRTALGWFGRAAETGHAEAAGHYVWLRAHHSLAPLADEARIARQLQQQAGADTRATHVLSSMYLYGYGVPADAAESLRLLERAALTGDVLARDEMLDRLLTGALGQAADPPGAIVFLKRVAATGDRWAMDRLASLLLEGPQALRDVAEGYRWAMRAACVSVEASGFDPSGQGLPWERLAVLFENGMTQDGAVVIAPDLVQAHMWALIAYAPLEAGEGAHVQPRRLQLVHAMLTRIETRMTPAQIDEGRRRAAAWQPMTAAEALQEPFDLPRRQ